MARDLSPSEARPGAPPQASEDLLRRIYRSMRRIRRVEERIIEIYATDKIKSPVHLSIGQEAPSVGLCEALRPSDVVFGTYRGHALYLAKGGDLKAMIAELFGKRDGCGRGKAGSMHLAWKPVHMMGTSAIVGTTIPQAVGYAFAEKVRGRDTVVAACFGDGALEEGVFTESVNFASLKKLPVLFVCENNLYAIHTPFGKRTPKSNFCERVRVYGVAVHRVTRNDVVSTYRAASEAAAAMRAGDGPHFIEIETYRWREHVGPGEDWHLGYRAREEAAPWIKADEIARIGARLSEKTRAAIDAEVEAEVDEAFACAEASIFPRDEELFDHVIQP